MGYLTLIRVLGLGVGLLAAGAGGWKLRDADYQRHLRHDAVLTTKVIRNTREIEKGLVTLSSALRDKGDAEEAQIHTITKIIERRVPSDVSSTPQEQAIVAGGGLPLGFVRSHTASVLGVDPELTASSSAQSGDPTGVSLSTLATVDAGNYDVLHICVSRLQRWDEFYETLKAKWPSNSPPEGPRP